MYTNKISFYLFTHIRVIFLLVIITCLFSEYSLNYVFSSDLPSDSVVDSNQEQSSEESTPSEPIRRIPPLKSRKPMTETEKAIFLAKGDLIREIESVLQGKGMTVVEAENLKEKVRSSEVTDVEKFKREMEREIQLTMRNSKVPRHPFRNPYPGGFILALIIYFMYRYFKQEKKNPYYRSR